MRVCGAKTRQGTPCQRAPMPNGRCYLHGGKSLIGAASPTFKTGRYSKYLPSHLAQRYEEARTDRELLALRDEIALLDARLGELLDRIGTGESASRWQDAQKAFSELKKARVTSDAKLFVEAMDNLDNALYAEDDYALWDEIASLLDLRKRLVESERKRLVEMQSMITSERAMVLLATVVDIIRNHVRDRNALAAISADFRKLSVVEPGG